MKLLLVILMLNLLLINFFSSVFDRCMKITSLSLGRSVFFIMLFNIKFVIVNDGAFGVEGDDSCL